METKELYQKLNNLLISYKKEKIFNKLSLLSFEKFYNNKTFFLIEENNEIIGFCLWKQRKDWIYIDRLCIKKENHKSGHGTSILNMMKSLFTVLRLNVGKTNQKAINFYLKNEFNFINKLKEDKYKSIASYSMEWKNK